MKTQMTPEEEQRQIDWHNAMYPPSDYLAGRSTPLNAWVTNPKVPSEATLRLDRNPVTGVWRKKRQ